MFDDFFIRALTAGLGLALVTGPLGCFVIWRRLSFFADETNKTEKEIFISKEKASVTPNNAEWANVPAKKDNLLQITKQPKGPVTNAKPRPAVSALMKKSSNIYFLVSIVPSVEWV
jgi:hypothetical protein